MIVVRHTGHAIQVLLLPILVVRENLFVCWFILNVNRLGSMHFFVLFLMNTLATGG